jgi:hypothetical protein
VALADLSGQRIVVEKGERVVAVSSEVEVVQRRGSSYPQPCQIETSNAHVESMTVVVLLSLPLHPLEGHRNVLNGGMAISKVESALRGLESVGRV